MPPANIPVEWAQKCDVQHFWAPTRRNFEEQVENHPGPAGEALDLIGGIYGIEKRFRLRPLLELLEARRTRTRTAKQ